MSTAVDTFDDLGLADDLEVAEGGVDGEEEQQSEYGGGGSEFEDVAEATSANQLANIRTAVNRFNSFLRKLSDATKTIYIPFDDQSVESLQKQQTIVGQFGGYLYSEKKITCGTARNYVSKIRNQILKRTKNTSDVADGRWFTQLSRNLNRKFDKRCTTEGTSLSNSAEPLFEADLQRLCEQLFETNTKEAVMQRALLILQWQTLGRVSEVTSLPASRLTWYSPYQCLSIHMSRPKAQKSSDLNVFLHRTSWQHCPLHAIGK
jgi:site-specific recombinase XerD